MSQKKKAQAIEKSDHRAPDAATTSQSLLEFDAIMKGAPMGILFTQNSIMVQANPGFVEMMGYQLNELIGQPASLLFFTVPESYAEVARIAGPAIAAGRSFRADVKASHKDGSVFWTRFSAKAVDPENNQKGTLWFIEDITAEHLHQQTLRRTLEEQKAIFNSAAVGILYSYKRTISRCNNRLASMFGYQPDELPGRSTRLFFRSETDFAELSGRISPSLQEKGDFSVEIQIPHKDGHLIWVHATGSPVEGAALMGDEMIWIFSDISARKAAEYERRQSLRELEAVFANAAVGFIYTRNHTVQRCNNRCAEILGYTVEELTGQATFKVFPTQEDYRLLREVAGPLMSRGLSYEAEVACRRKDGTLAWCHLYGKALNTEDVSQGSIWIVVDTQETRRTREDLAASMRDLNGLIENAPVGILFTRDGKILRYNPHFSVLSGYPGETAIGLSTAIFFRSQEEYEDYSRKVFPILNNGLPLHSELYIQHGSDNRSLWVKLIAYLANPAEPDQGAIWLVEDRSAYKESEIALYKAQADLAQAEKQLALGSLVVGVAHELNTPIGNGLMAASTLRERCQDMSAKVATGQLRRSQLDSYLLDIGQLAELLIRTCERSAQLVSSFKQVAVGGRVDQRSSFDLLSLVQQSVAIAGQGGVASGLDANLDLDPGAHRELDVAAGISVGINVSPKIDISVEISAEITCDSYPDPLLQVISGLVENALTHAFVGRSAGALNISALCEQGWIELRFLDDGIGMDAITATRIFDPFFTTRLGQGGSGLGLSISRNLATVVLGGELNVESQPASGTCFVLRFPVTAP